MNDDAFDFDKAMADLEEKNPLASAPSTKSSVVQIKHKCLDCDGTGVFRGHYRMLHPKKCFACKGQGWFKRSASDRAKDRAAYRKAKVTKLEGKQELFREQNPGVIEFLEANQWSDFLCNVLSSYHKYGSLTDKQVAAVLTQQAKQAARQEQRAREQEARKVDVDLSPIKAMFDTAREAGLKRTKYRAEGLVLFPAGVNSQNAGAIYVTRDSDEQYLGKVIGGKFLPVWEAKEEDKAAVLRIAENPKEAAVRWGKKTGRCSCCGRELTDPNSIAAGIGPICATKWGF